MRLRSGGSARSKRNSLSKAVLFGEDSLWRVLNEYSRHYHGERNHQGRDNLLFFPTRAREETRKIMRLSADSALVAC